ncbi:rubrerythrin [candidate division BRC1 bacterium HGW-BRC1-1]|jgi:rubrerythrin|nr:MAG: rubrerythrin [candidate division BRC1 bacterium HGW-BRC1-1]
MLTQKVGAIALTLLALCFGANVACAAETTDTVAKSTIENLQAAFDGESNAAAKYEAYAKKADAEGHKGVGSLFRAASYAEKVHADNHAVVIKKMGAEPKADVKVPEPKSTKENLADALKGESYERDTMYPEFIAKARTDRNRDAIRTFNFAKSAEAEHAKLYKAALDNLDDWKDARDFYVCSVCGNTVLKIDFDKCPVCFEPKSAYKEIK